MDVDPLILLIIQIIYFVVGGSLFLLSLIEILLRKYYVSIDSILKDRFGTLDRAYHWCVLGGSTMTLVRGLDPFGNGYLGIYGMVLASDQCLNMIILAFLFTVYQVANICFNDLDPNLITATCILHNLPYLLGFFWIIVELGALGVDIYLIISNDFIFHIGIIMFYSLCGFVGFFLFQFIGIEMRKTFEYILPDFFFIDDDEESDDSDKSISFDSSKTEVIPYPYPRRGDYQSLADIEEEEDINKLSKKKAQHRSKSEEAMNKQKNNPPPPYIRSQSEQEMKEQQKDKDGKPQRNTPYRNQTEGETATKLSQTSIIDREKRERNRLMFSRYLRWNRIRIMAQIIFVLGFILQLIMGIQFFLGISTPTDNFLIFSNVTAILQNIVLILFAWYAFIPLHNPFTLCCGIQIYWKTNVDILYYPPIINSVGSSFSINQGIGGGGGGGDNKESYYHPSSADF